VIARLRKSDFARHGLIVFGGVAVASVFNYLYYMLLGRRVGVEGYGIVTALASTLLVIGAPAVVGQLIAARLAADLNARNDRAALRRLADVMTWWGLGAGALVVLAGVIFRQPLASFFNLSDATPVVVTAVALGLYAIVNLQRGVLQGAHRFEAFSLSQAIESLVKVIAGVLLAVALGAAGGLAGIAVGLIIALLFNLFSFRALFGTTRAPIALDRSLVVRVVSHVGIGWFTLTVLAFYDVPLIKHVFDSRSAGLYAAASLVGRAVLSAVSFIPTLVMPKANARIAEGKSPLPLLGAALGIAALIVAVSIGAAALAPRLLVTLIAGKAFGDAAPLVLLYVVAAGSLALANVAAAYKMGLHRYDFVAPALALAVAEVLVIVLWHPTLLAVVTVLAVGHTCVFASTLIGITSPVRSPLPAVALE
jgi:O-antigen/teichoic acid export membrane protein